MEPLPILELTNLKDACKHGLENEELLIHVDNWPEDEPGKQVWLTLKIDSFHWTKVEELLTTRQGEIRSIPRFLGQCSGIAANGWRLFITFGEGSEPSYYSYTRSSLRQH